MAIIPRAKPEVAPIASLAPVRNTTQVRPVEGIAQVGNQFAGAAMEQAQRLQEKEDVAALMSARRELSDWEASTFDPGNADGINAYKGQNALQANERLLPDLDRRMSQIGARLSPRQKARFEELSLSFRDSVAGRINGHMQREHEAFQAAEQKAAVANLTNDATQAALDGDFGLASIRATELLDMQRAKLTADGMPEELIKAAEREAVSGIHSQVVAGMLAQDPHKAQAYFDRYEGQMSAVDRTRALNELRPYVEDATADEAVVSARAGVPGVARDPGARGTPSPAVRSALDDAAKAAGLDAQGRAVLYALAEQESSFNPGAVNSEVLDDGDQATGLFQYRKTSADTAGLKDRTSAQESAEAAARELADRIKRGGVDFAIAAHFGGEGGAEAVVKRGESLNNPKTARYLEQVRGRAARWQKALGGDVTAGLAAKGAADTSPERQAVTLGEPQSEGEWLERVRNDPTLTNPRVRKLAEAKVREQWSQREQDRVDQERATREAINAAVWSGDPKRSLREILGPQYAFAAEKGMLGELSRDLIMRREGGDATRNDNKVVVGAYLDTLRSNPKAFAVMDVMKNARHMSPKTADDLLEMQKKVREGKVEDYASDGEQMTELLFKPLKIEGNDEVSKAKRAALQTSWFQMQRDFVARNGKKPSATEREQMMRRLGTSFALNDVQIAGKDTSYEGSGFATEVPADVRAQIVDALTRKGRGADEATIRRLYLQYVGTP